jgi:hypothetical protein
MVSAFKEWKSVCDALERGDQTIILRKGGIAEGREGFLWQHQEFFLFPTAYHDHREQLKGSAVADDASFAKRTDGLIEVRLRARIIWSADLDDIETVRKLDPFHIWKPEAIVQRFDYGKTKGIRLALLRVSRLQSPWMLEDSPAFGGCRSWIEFPEPDSEHRKLETVLDDVDFSARQTELEQLLSEEGVEITRFD